MKLTQRFIETEAPNKTETNSDVVSCQKLFRIGEVICQGMCVWVHFSDLTSDFKQLLEGPVKKAIPFRGVDPPEPKIRKRTGP